MADLNFIANVLEGNDDVALQHEPRRRRIQRQRQPPQRQSAEPSSSNATIINGVDYNTPGPSSTNEKAHCQACDVWINRPDPRAWFTHIQGIQHKRQLLSIREHGTPNQLVMSIFEDEPNTSNAHRIAGKSSEKIGIRMHIKRVPPMNPIVKNTIHALHLSALSIGMSNFNEGIQRRTMACEQAILNFYNSIKFNSRDSLDLSHRGLIAVCAGNFNALLSKATDIRMHTCVNYDPIFRGYLTSMLALHAFIVAYLNATDESIHTIGITSEHLTYDEPTVALFTQRWSAVMRLLKQVFETKMRLTKFRIRFTANSNLSEGIRNGTDLAILKSISREQVVLCRTAVLMGIHPRLGEHSPLRSLPMNVIKEILDCAYPRQDGICDIDFDVER